jgi:hypothetical protein
MAKKPISYAGLALDDAPAVQPVEGVAEAEAIEAPAAAPRRARTPQKATGKGEKGQPYVTYLNPLGHRALRLYALESGGSVQGIIIEALETWAKKHGLTEPMRPDRTK